MLRPKEQLGKHLRDKPISRRRAGLSDQGPLGGVEAVHLFYLGQTPIHPGTLVTTEIPRLLPYQPPSSGRLDPGKQH